MVKIIKHTYFDRSKVAVRIQEVKKSVKATVTSILESDKFKNPANFIIGQAQEVEDKGLVADPKSFKGNSDADQKQIDSAIKAFNDKRTESAEERRMNLRRAKTPSTERLAEMVADLTDAVNELKDEIKELKGA